MRASSGPQGRVEKPPIQIGDEHRQASGVSAIIGFEAFIEINAEECVDAAKKGLIIRASLLITAPETISSRRCETGRKGQPQRAFPVETIFNN
jgi:hypothetical protein